MTGQRPNMTVNHSVLQQSPLMQRKNTAGRRQHRASEGQCVQRSCCSMERCRGWSMVLKAAERLSKVIAVTLPASIDARISLWIFSRAVSNLKGKSVKTKINCWASYAYKQIAYHMPNTNAVRCRKFHANIKSLTTVNFLGKLSLFHKKSAFLKGSKFNILQARNVNNS